MGRILRCTGLFGVLTLVSLSQITPVEAGTCSTFKWYQACGPTSEQDCHTACGSCQMCLSVYQFNPCVYECRCAC
jgi:hypothetical protein